MRCISIGPRTSEDRPAKGTADNTEETGEFVSLTSSRCRSPTPYPSPPGAPAEADEFGKAGLTPAPCGGVGVPRVARRVSMECLLDRVLPLDADHLPIVRPVRFHVCDDRYVANGRMNVPKPWPLGSLAVDYTKVETIFDLPAEYL